MKIEEKWWSILSILSESVPNFGLKSAIITHNESRLTYYADGRRRTADLELEIDLRTL